MTRTSAARSIDRTAVDPARASEVHRTSGPPPKEAPLLARPAPQRFLQAAASAEAVVKPSALWMAEALEEKILEQVAEVKAMLDAKGLDPATVQMTYAADITGREVSVCLACGVVGHDFQPSVQRQENVAIDMHAEAIVVFMEVMTRLGISHGVVAYDDAGVLVLRDVGPPGTQTQRSGVMERFEAFRTRHTTADVTDKSWIESEKTRWIPTDEFRKMAGEPDDALCFSTVSKLFANAEDASFRGLVVAKSQVPMEDLAIHEHRMASNGIKVAGIAVGEDAEAVADAMFSETEKAPGMHDLRFTIGKGAALALSQA